MLPVHSRAHLGWPGSFPGEAAAGAYSANKGKNHGDFDAIIHHAVYDAGVMKAYVKPNPYVFTLLREPLSRLHSAFEFYSDRDLPPSNSSWADRIRFLESRPPVPSRFQHPKQGMEPARYLNSMARDLGWYAKDSGNHSNGSQIPAINRWIKEVEQGVDLVLITEFFDEGLLLLRQELNFSIEDLRHVRKHVAQKRSRMQPTAPELARLQLFLAVDSHLYAYFKQIFLQKWNNAGGYDAFSAELKVLRALNEDLNQACNGTSAGLIRLAGATPCPCQMKLKGGDYTELLKQAAPRQVDAVATDVATGKLVPGTGIFHHVYFILIILAFVFMLWTIILTLKSRLFPEEDEGEQAVLRHTLNSESSPSVWTADVKLMALIFVVAALIGMACYTSTHGVSLDGMLLGLTAYVVTLLPPATVQVLRFLVLRMCQWTRPMIEVYIGPRDHWTLRTLQWYSTRMGERRVKILDASTRRVGHVLVNTLNSLVMTSIVTNQHLRVQSIFFQTCIGLFIKCSLVSSNSALASIIFQGARIRDGSFGRMNLVMVKFVRFAFYPLAAMLLLRIPGVDPGSPVLGRLTAYVYQPLIWGDTAAEIIGSFFGRMEFPVYGFGEINKKTVEGCLACFFASLSTCWLVAQQSDFPADSFGVPAIVLHVLVAFIATIAETWSPRGTDNGFMVLSATCTVVFLFQSGLTI